MSLRHAGEPARPALSAVDVAAALDIGQIDIQFQPIVRLADRAAVALEALARLQHPLHGTLMPDWFIPQAELAGLSMRLAEAVVSRALRDIDPAFLLRHALLLTINLPLDVLLQPQALSLLETHRQAAGVSAANLLIELTESRPVYDVASLDHAMQRWRAAGYRLAIDDLGPKIINQARLFDLPFHTVKLDKSVVSHPPDDEPASRYLQHAVGRARARSMCVIAEGIETEARWRQMHALGVDHAQGFLIAHPMPMAALEGWLQGWSTMRPVGV